MPESEARRPIRPDDLLRIRWVSDVRISPDGAEILFTVRRVADDGTRYLSWIARAAFDGPPVAAVGPMDGLQDSGARWSPDGSRIGYVSRRGGNPQIWIVDAQGDRPARQVTDVDGGVLSPPVWSPDGRHIAFLAGVVDEELGTEALVDEGGRKYRVFKRVQTKHDGRGYWNGRRSHIFIVSADADANDAVPAALQVTDGSYDHVDPAWSPDGRTLAFVADRAPDGDLRRERDLWIMDVRWLRQGGPAASEGRLTRLSTGLHGAAAPNWSPNGRFVAFYANDGVEDRATNVGLWLADPRTRRLVNLTFDFDRSLGDWIIDDMHTAYGHNVAPPLWTSDSGSVYVMATDHGSTHVFRVDVPSDLAFEQGRPVSHGFSDASDSAGRTFNVTRVLGGPRRIFALDFNGAGQMAFAATTTTQPGEVFAASLSGAKPAGTNASGGDGSTSEAVERQVTYLNSQWLSEIKLADHEPIVTTGGLGAPIYGFLMKPSDFAPGKKYPLVLEIHGGPYVAWGNAFMQEFQLLAAHGFCVLYTNPHGSKGYGAQLVMDIKRRRGEIDYEDFIAVTDAACARDFVDASRLGITGESYGGWAVNWVITHTNRFAAAVCDRGTSNRHSAWGNSQMGYLHSNWETPGPPWVDPDFYMRQSPINYADRCETPLLIIHGSEDALCDVSEAEQMFKALKVQRKPVEWILFLGECHHMARVGTPQNRIVRLERIAAWFDRYLKRV
jgi:dipeptidyl aminopeptidase/acylaminoacyl peptidase